MHSWHLYHHGSFIRGPVSKQWVVRTQGLIVMYWIKHCAYLFSGSSHVHT